jgi:uncharacterized protein YdhG (YjbR/CyaY superfamily)
MKNLQSPIKRPIEDYISEFPDEMQKLLHQILDCIRKAAPDASEKIGYGIPTFTLNGKNLVHFGGFKHHIGFYPGPDGIKHFASEFSAFNSSKGAVQFPLDQKLPLALIRKVVKYRVKQVDQSK